MTGGVITVTLGTGMGLAAISGAMASPIALGMIGSCQSISMLKYIGKDFKQNSSSLLSAMDYCRGYFGET